MSTEVLLLLIAVALAVGFALGVWLASWERKIKDTYDADVLNRDLKKELSDLIALNASLSARYESLKAERDMLNRRIDSQAETIKELAEEKG